MDERTCTEPGCGKPHVAKGLCRTHYQRQWKTGSTVLVSPEQRFLAFVQKGEECWYWIGDVTDQGYGRCRYLGRKTGAHRAAHELFIGPIPDGLEVDHGAITRIWHARVARRVLTADASTQPI